MIWTEKKDDEFSYVHNTFPMLWFMCYCRGCCIWWSPEVFSQATPDHWTKSNRRLQVQFKIASTNISSQTWPLKNNQCLCRANDHGSDYIQTFCKYLKMDYKNKSVEEIFSIVNKVFVVSSHKHLIHSRFSQMYKNGNIGFKIILDLQFSCLFEPDGFSKCKSRCRWRQEDSILRLQIYWSC